MGEAAAAAVLLLPLRTRCSASGNRSLQTQCWEVQYWQLSFQQRHLETVSTVSSALYWKRGWLKFQKLVLYGSKSLQNVPKLPSPQQLNSVRGMSPEPQIAQSGK